MTAPETDFAWWERPEYDKHDAIITRVRHIRQQQGDRKIGDLMHHAMYGGAPFSAFGLAAPMRKPIAAASRLSLNVCRNMVNAVVSKIAAKNKPKPTFLTENGNYELRQKAQNLEKFVQGVFYESKVYPALTSVFRDACVYGTGVLKVLPGRDCVEVARTLPMEIVVDDVEGADATPNDMAQRKYIDRLVMIKRAKEWLSGDKEQLTKALAALSVRTSPDPEDAEFAFQTIADQVLVTEAWHLGAGHGEMGRHAIVINGCTLVDEEWEGPFPFAFMRWTPALTGFFGEGLVEELMGVQQEINKLLRQIQRGQHLITGHYLVEMGSKVTQQHINNDLAAIVKYSGTKPEYVAPNIISPEVYAHLWQLYAKAYEITGIPQLSASGLKPAGLDSGEAQRVYNDQASERFLEVGQGFEELVVEAARQVVRCAKRVGGGYRVKAVEGSGVDFIDWSDVDIGEDLVVIRVYPTSLLPSTPAGKLAWMQDMLKSGAMPPEDVLEVVDFPDIDSYKKRKLAPRKLIERNIARILKTGEYPSPEPFDDHKLALTLVNEAYAEARLDMVPEEKLELLRRYMADTVDLSESSKALPPAAPPMPPMGPPGMMPPDGPLPGMPPPPMPMQPTMPFAA